MLHLMVLITGLMAGIYLTFSLIIMKSLGQLPPLQAAQAMNKINSVIINTLFLPLFVISTLVCAILIIWSFADWHTGQSWLVVTAGLTYIIGMFLVTAFGNVPLNNQLMQIEYKETELIKYWGYYQKNWTRLNHFRTFSCTASCVLFTLTLNYDLLTY